MAKVCVRGDCFSIHENGDLCVKPGAVGLRERLVYECHPMDDLPSARYALDPANYPWLARVDVQVQGGGGSGGGCDPIQSGQRAMAGGGGGGGYARRLIDIATLGQCPIIVEVGCGGDGASSGGGGHPGSNSLFGAFMLAYGGGGAQSGIATATSHAADGGEGGTATGGDINIEGGHGGHGMILNDAGGNTMAIRLNHGGGAFLATVEYGPTGSNSGRAGHQYGGGSSGASSLTNSQPAKGSNPGADGVVIVDLYG